MSERRQNEYIPDFVTPPGETLLETLEALGLSQAKLAERTGRSKKTVNEIIKGKAPITPRMAIELERVLGVPAGFWNNRERIYQEWRARDEEREKLKKHQAWLRLFPVSAMIKFGWIQRAKDPVQQMEALLSFLGLASPDQWEPMVDGLEGQVAFRRSAAFDVDKAALVAWLRAGEIEGRSVDCAPFEPKRFVQALKEVRSLTRTSSDVFQPEVTRLCAACGVAVVFVPELPKARVSGATRWLSPNKALLQLSFRYKADDHLWFSFFHEAGHILKHGKREIFVEGSSAEMDEAKEAEADAFAENVLIPPPAYRKFLTEGRTTKASITAFADELGTAPGIVVGRLQHDGVIPHSHCNDLKKRLDWPGRGNP